MSTKSLKLDTFARKMIAIAFAAVITGFAFYTAKWGFASALALRADTTDIAEMAVRMGPDDPQTHYTAAVLFDRTFDAADAELSLAEYERAAELSPNNYNIWLELGGAREQNGDVDGAETAFLRASQLAPHYARVSWVLGNFLLRRQRFDEGFAEIRKAAASDPKYIAPATATAWQILPGDIGQIRNLIGGSPEMNLSLAALLANEKRFEEAIYVWSSINPAAKTEFPMDTVNALFVRFHEAKRFRDALAIRSNRAAIGKIYNGGFEEPVMAEKAEIFDWQISNGNDPRAAISDSQKHGGKFSLLLKYNSQGGQTNRQISQTVAVEPGGQYTLEAFYRTDIKTGAGINFEVENTVDRSILAATPPTSLTDEWVRISVDFTIPDNADGIVLHIVPEKCVAADCRVTGNLWIDDISISLQQ